MSKSISILLIIVGVVLNNVVYLQDLWFGQGAITLDGPKAYIAIAVSIIIILAGVYGLMKRAN